MAGSLLELQGLTKDFGGLRAISDFDLSLADGQMLAIVGPNGCGKTTLFNLISGALIPSAGSIRLRGREIAGRPPHIIAALGIARKFQMPSIFADLSVRENILLASLAGRAPGGFYRLAKADPNARGWEKAIALAGLDKSLDYPAGTLSHGQRQRLEIAMILCAEPVLLLLDEPTAGMTMGESAEAVGLLKEMHAASKSAMIVIEHDMEVVRALGAPVMVMLRGRPLCFGTYEEVRRDARVREAYLGTEV